MRGPPTLSYPADTGGCFPGSKAEGREADYSHTFTAEVKKKRSHTSTHHTFSRLPMMTKEKKGGDFQVGYNTLGTLTKILEKGTEQYILILHGLTKESGVFACEEGIM